MSDLTELQKIRDAFQFNIKIWFHIAHSLIAISSIGEDAITEKAFSSSGEDTTTENEQSYLDSTYTFGLPTIINGMPIIANMSTMTYGEIWTTYIKHKGAITELVYERIIQDYYHFLNQIIEQIVKEHISGIKQYPKIPKIKIAIDFNSTDILEELPITIRENFDFSTKNVDKTSEIEKCLDKNLDERLKKEIKKAIIVRNLLEHHQGIIRYKDIQNTGSNSIKLIDNSTREKDFQENDKVEITIYELFRLKEVLLEAAATLIPD